MRVFCFARVPGQRLLGQVAGILPGDFFDPDEAVAQIRAYLAGERTQQATLPSAMPAADPVRAFRAEADKLVRRLHHITAGIKAAREAATAQLPRVFHGAQREGAPPGYARGAPYASSLTGGR